MSYTKELLLVQLAHAKQAIDRARNNRYSDTPKQRYQERLVLLFERVEAFVMANPALEDTVIYDGPKNHLDFIFKSLEFLDSSTLNQIPYEIVACLTHAMKDSLDPYDNFIIVTSLVNDVAGFSYDRWLAIDDDLYNDINTKYGIVFEHRLVQINLPRTFARDYFATVVLYHELGHFIDAKYSLISRAHYFILYLINEGTYYNDPQLAEIKSFLPGLTSYIDASPKPEIIKANSENQMSLRHLKEYFCDLFAAQYVDNTSNQLLI